LGDAVIVDDEEAKSHAGLVIGDDLSAVSVDELNGRITALEQEILRLRAEITAKQSSRSAADGFFKQ